MTGATIAAPAAVGNARAAGSAPLVGRCEGVRHHDDPGDDPLRALVEALGSGERHRRREAAIALATAVSAGERDASTVDPLLRHPSGEVRWGAAFALHRSGHSNATVVEVALAALADADGDVRWAAVGLLVEALARESALAGRLRERFRSGEAAVRKMAFFCLARGGQLVGADFEAAFADDHPQVRLAAWTALARSASASPSVLGLARDAAAREADPAVARAATAVLARVA